MASTSSPLTASAFLIMFITLMTNKYHASGCYTSILGFGDSITDTGNFLLLSPSNVIWHTSLPPYGETFFHRPTGRSCDGRLVIDFLAEYFRLPLVPPSVGITKGYIKATSRGANFAVAGSMTLDVEFYARTGISNSATNITMTDQLNQFKQLWPSLCQTSSSCTRQLQSSLVLLGPFGGNDYTHSFESGKKLDEIQPFVPVVVNAIASAIDELVDLGAMTILVPGMLPIGCAPSYLTFFETANAEEYDEIGCLVWLNKLAEYHDELLQRELQQTRERHPDANIIYADYYHSAMELYRNPTKYGFTSKGTLKACCGIGGLYNYDSSAPCGFPPAKSCDNPSFFINWDGYHLTEAAYRWISRGLLEGKYTVPRINTICLSTKVEHFQKT